MVTPRPSPPPGKLRIIGGSLRGSRVAVPDKPGLRPTPDRARETLFNWLAPVIQGARCLDLFAGTGALGIEALSRGAAQVDFVEVDARLADLIRANLDRLKQAARVHVADGVRFLAQGSEHFDIVFLDPPFAANLWGDAARALEAHGRLLESAWIYVESPADAEPELPQNWALHREGHAGEVRFALYRRVGPSAKL
ncbi:MAG TPA: 16S rRNA (guanine(966)-N(2))-methyltransferase RsmD [Rudaea sp.]|nr:16S rRNA (guanine(966)-N(2))-methyltransferase RsmD [Rudaea sp.]